MSQRLQELRAELAKHFGKTTRWKALCKQQNATTEEEQIKLAEQALAEWSTGTVAEWQSHKLDLQGVKPMSLDEFLGQRKTLPSETQGEPSLSGSLENRANRCCRDKRQTEMTDIDEFCRSTVQDFLARQQGVPDRFDLKLSPDAVVHLIKSAYYASLIPDEGRWPRVTLMCYRKGSENQFHLLFPSLDITPAEVAKLSHAVGKESHLCCIADKGALDIRGIHINLLNDRRDLGYASFRLANPLKVSIRRPGHIEVSTGGIASVYQAGEMSDEALLESSNTMKQLMAVIGPKMEFYTDGVVESLEDIFNDIVAAIVQLGHGGLLLFAEEQKRSYFSSCREVDLLLLQDLLVRYWQRVRDLRAEAGGISNLLDKSSVGKYRNSLGVAHCVERLEKCVRTVADLSGMDGAIAFDYECKIVAFNAIIAKGNEEPKGCHFVDERSVEITYEQMVRNRGSRHQAAVSFVMRVPNSFAFVISHDGSVSAFRSDDKKVVSCERGMRVLL